MKYLKLEPLVKLRGEIKTNCPWFFKKLKVFIINEE